jgi:transposase
MRTKPRAAAIFGIDIGKTVFNVAGIDAAGSIVQAARFSRRTLLGFFSNAAPSIVAMEACPGSQWLGRKLQALGHDVRILPGQFVKPYVKSQKNDVHDARAIAEAAARASMRCVQLRTVAQLETQALHRVRQRLMGERTALINQMRALLLEFGVTCHQGPGRFKADFPGLVAEESNDLTPRIREILLALREELRELEERVERITHQIERDAAADATARRLITVPGVGKLSASALVSAAGDARQFAKSRDLAAWLGLVPAQHSTGGKQTLLGITKRGNVYLRTLLIHGARACVIHLDRSRDRLGRWIDSLEKRMHRNKVVVALANKLARIVWNILRDPRAIYEGKVSHAA